MCGKIQNSVSRQTTDCCQAIGKGIAIIAVVVTVISILILAIWVLHAKFQNPNAKVVFSQGMINLAKTAIGSALTAIATGGLTYCTPNGQLPAPLRSR